MLILCHKDTQFHALKAVQDGLEAQGLPTIDPCHVCQTIIKVYLRENLGDTNVNKADRLPGTDLSPVVPVPRLALHAVVHRSHYRPLLLSLKCQTK